MKAIFWMVCLVALTCLCSPQVSKKQGGGTGLFPVVVNGKWGYIDKTGEFVIQPQFDSAGDFSEGWAWIRSGVVWQTGRLGYIDKTGGYVWNPTN